MKFSDDFESFLRTEVNLDGDRLDTLQKKVDEIETFIAAHDDFADLFLDVIPAGSWAYRTIIRPVQDNDEFDADILLYLKEQSGWKPKDYIENLYKAFRSSTAYQSIAHRMTRCVRIDYPGKFHVDVVPYLERYGHHYITNRSEPEGEGRFELSYPEGFTEWIDERQRLTSGNFMKVVRLAKYLRDFKNTFSCKSVILTTLLGNEVNQIEASYNAPLYADVPSAMVTLFGKLAESLPISMPAVIDPGGSGDNFTDRYKDDWNYDNFRTQIVYYADKMQRAYDETDRTKSIELWREVFGDTFKPGSLPSVASLSPVSSALPAAGEQFIDQPPFGYPLDLQPQYQARITARCTGLRTGQVYRRNGFRQFTLAKSGNRVPKNRNLQFRVSTDVPEPRTIYWKVRNGGTEAATIRQLRGEITKDAGGGVKNETTSYKGTHYVDCYVVSNGRVVARDRQIVIVTGR